MPAVQPIIALLDKIEEIFDEDYFLPVHQGRACGRYACALRFVRPKRRFESIPMNFQFGTSVGKLKYCGGDYVYVFAGRRA